MLEKMQCLLIFIVITLLDPSVAFHGYSKRQQYLWSKVHKSCAGKRQSPIALSTLNSTVRPLPALEMVYFRNFLPGLVVVENTGNSVALNVRNKSSRLPYVFGAILPENNEYEFEGLHFHWGSRNNKGSEHVLNDIRYPLEMHIIFRNMAYPNVSEALKHHDGLSVLGIFFQLHHEDNDRLRPLLHSLPLIKRYGRQSGLNISITLSSLLPTDTDTFYTYQGSLTTPPCSEAVTWFIFATPVPVSAKQMNRFRKLSNGKRYLVNNFRHVQNLDERIVYLRKLTLAFARDKTSISGLKWSW